MEIYNVLDALFQTLRKDVPPQMVRSVGEIIMKTIPQELVLSGFEVARRVHTPGRKINVGGHR